MRERGLEPPCPFEIKFAAERTRTFTSFWDHGLSNRDGYLNYITAALSGEQRLCFRHSPFSIIKQKTIYAIEKNHSHNSCDRTQDCYRMFARKPSYQKYWDIDSCITDYSDNEKSLTALSEPLLENSFRLLFLFFDNFWIHTYKRPRNAHNCLAFYFLSCPG